LNNKNFRNGSIFRAGHLMPLQLVAAWNSD